ncbi:uncharacterized protein METZ01_LOCUS16174 [marine metagenome]|uniref:Uncharacterized protein n=1 Tax=marine metagenome TaxID=408172 RepID=A0A381P8T3_9ZZZZ
MPTERIKSKSIKSCSNLANAVYTKIYIKEIKTEK